MAFIMTTRYLGGIKFETVHAATGAKTVTDVSLEEGVQKTSFSPGELLGASLASCSSSMLAAYAVKHDLDLTGLTTDTDVAYDEKGNIQSISITFNMPKQDYSDKDRKVLTQYAKSCPVGKALNESVEKNITFLWPEA